MESQFFKIFQRSQTQQEKEFCQKNKINKLSDFIYKYPKENFNHSEGNSFELLKTLSSILQVDDEDLIGTFISLRENGITSTQLLQQNQIQLSSLNINLDYIKKIEQRFNRNITSDDVCDYNQAKSLNKNYQSIKNISSNQKFENQKKITEELKNIMSSCHLIQDNKVFPKKIYVYPQQNSAKLDNQDKYYSVLLIGESGSGKSSFLNYLINYYYEVTYNDNFRFILEKQEQSTNDIVSTWLVRYQQKIGLNIIDTPGFQLDFNVINLQSVFEKILNQIRKMKYINCICFILSANNPRLTQAQNFLFNSIINLFGQQMLPNFKFIFTNTCDEKVPKTFLAMKFSGDSQNSPSQFAPYLSLLANPAYYQVNCQNMFQQNEYQQLQEYFWNLTMKNINEFYKNLQNMAPVKSDYILEIQKDKMKAEQIRLFKETLQKSLLIKQRLKDQEKKIYQNEKNRHEQISSFYDLRQVQIEDELKLKEAIEKYCLADDQTNFFQMTNYFISEQLQKKEDKFKWKIKIIRNVEKMKSYELIMSRQTKIPQQLSHQ